MHRPILRVRDHRAVQVRPDDLTILSDVAFLQIERLDFSLYQPQALAPIGLNILRMSYFMKAVAQQFDFGIA